MSAMKVCTTLVERERQTRHLAEVFDACAAGHSPVAVLSGPPGSGKTALLGWFRDLAAREGASVLSATALPQERDLPLGVVDQLLYDARSPGPAAERIGPLLADIAADRWHDAMLGADQQSTARALRRLCSAFAAVARVAPLVIAVDDTQHADLASQQCLASLIARLRGTRTMIVLTEGDGPAPVSPLIHAALRRNGEARPLRLAPLSAQGVATLLDRFPGLSGAERAGRAHAVTGGNPLLLRALIEDALASPPDQEPFLLPGEVFGHAFRACLCSAEPAVQAVAQAFAVLEPAFAPARAAQLLDTTQEAVERGMAALTRAGLLDAGRFRCPEARAAVLDTLLPDELAEMHASAARLAHRDREPAEAVSRHLVAVDRIEPGWAVPVLLEAAEQVLAAGDAEHALACLRQAESACDDLGQQARILSLKARTKWRTDPSAAAPYLPDLVAAVRDGLLGTRQSAALVHALYWHDRPDLGAEVLDLLPASAGAGERAEGLDEALLWTAYTFPQQAAIVRARRTRLGLRDAAADGATPAALVAGALAAAGIDGPAAAAAAEEALRRMRPGGEYPTQAYVALQVLLRIGRADAAAFWCDALLGPAVAADETTLEALLLAVRAEIALAKGDLAAAEADAHKALDLISTRGWGLAVGAVLATLVMTATESGRDEDAARYLGLPVPAGMMCTVFGLRYLFARGLYYLAAGRVGDALIDLRECGRTAAALGCDIPGVVPWRLGLAAAHLADDERECAARLAADQLRMLAPEHGMLRGRALRVLACAGEPKHRMTMLREAIELLKGAEDWLGVARAYADVSETLDASGETSRARLTLRTARTIARQCQAIGLLRRMSAGVPAVPGTVGAQAAVAQSAAPELSDAERRIVGLVVLGHTNREIASALWVTISTVEQHLTRVYRKLGITRRAELPEALA